MCLCTVQFRHVGEDSTFTPFVLLTQEGWGWDGAITTGDHDADPRLYEGHGELHDLRPLLIDGEGAYGHVGPLGHHLKGYESTA